MNYVTLNSSQISVANMSLVNQSGSAPVAAISGLLSGMVNAGVVVVAAVGNDGNDLAGPDNIYGNGDNEGAHLDTAPHDGAPTCKSA